MQHVSSKAHALDSEGTQVKNWIAGIYLKKTASPPDLVHVLWEKNTEETHINLTKKKGGVGGALR